MKARALCLVLAIVWATSASAASATTIVVPYGPAPTSFGELTVPAGAGPFPVVVWVHGGCWRADRGSTASFRAMAKDLEAHGIATWNIEYRRVGNAGGGWPGTFEDLGEAVDLLTNLAEKHPLNLRRVVLAGHSSGGHFAAWLATRRQLPASSEIRGKPQINFAGLVLADAFIDPLVIDSKGADGKLYCDEPLLERLVGGTPEAQPQRLHEISPLQWLPWGVPQEYVVSSRRYPVTPSRPLADGRTTMTMADYPALARASGDRINVEIIDDAEHASFTQAGTLAFGALERALLRAATADSKVGAR
jgi:acetyl esterase/lipase